MDQKENQPPSHIEIAKALKQVRAVSDDDHYEQVLRILSPTRDATITRAVQGLTEEDEFALMCMLMKTATHVVPLEQKTSIAVGDTAPDLLARFQPSFSFKGIPPSQHSGYRCFVEVKSTKKNKFSIKGASLRKLRRFADSFTLPLVFAVRFLCLPGAALWVMVEDADKSTNSLKITVSDWLSGLRPVLWDEYSYMLMPGTYFQRTYSRTVTGSNVRHLEYGEQTTFQVVTPSNRYGFSGHDAFLASAFFDAYGLTEIASKHEGELTHVAYRAENTSLSIADLVYAMNRLPRDSSGRLVYDATRVIRELADGHPTSLIGRDLVEQLGGKFSDIDALGILEHGEREARYQRWLATCEHRGNA